MEEKPSVLRSGEFSRQKEEHMQNPTVKQVWQVGGQEENHAPDAERERK